MADLGSKVELMLLMPLPASLRLEALERLFLRRMYSPKDTCGL